MLYSSPKWAKLASIAASLRNIKYSDAKFPWEHQKTEYSYRIPIKTTITTSKREVNKYPCTSNKGTGHAQRPASLEGGGAEMQNAFMIENSGLESGLQLLFAVSPRKQTCSGTDLVWSSSETFLVSDWLLKEAQSTARPRLLDITLIKHAITRERQLQMPYLHTQSPVGKYIYLSVQETLELHTTKSYFDHAAIKTCHLCVPCTFM